MCAALEILLGVLLKFPVAVVAGESEKFSMRILFAFVHNWAKEVADYERGLVPSHRLFGYADLKKAGHSPRLCPMPRVFPKVFSKPIVWRIYQALLAFFKQQEHDCIFAVNEASAQPMLVLKRLGLLRTPLIVFNTGLMHRKNMTGWRRTMWCWLLPGADAVVSQTSMERDNVWPTFGLREDRQFLLHMMVDLEFFQRDPQIARQDYILAVGTTDARDFPTLLAALPEGQKLVIVTDPYNAEIIERHRKPGMQLEVLQAVQIKQLKRMYQEAKAIAIPLNDTPYGSGHTFLLENMVLGNVSIVTNVPGISEYFEDGVSAIGVKVGDVADLAEKLRAYLAAPEHAAEIRLRAPEWVKEFSSECFARNLIKIAEAIRTPAIHKARATILQT
jgi:glycosyltransferase involved in cell wall biosynthesis